MYQRSFSIASRSWSNSLPVLDIPFWGESVIGFLLRLDHLNNYIPGTIIDNVSTTPFGLKNFSLERLEVIESKLDYSVLASLVGLDQEEITHMTIAHTRKRLFRYDCSYSSRIFPCKGTKVCPICLKDWKIPFLFQTRDMALNLFLHAPAVHPFD